MKDNFSVQSKEYAGFRPQYPKAFYDFIFQHVKNFDKALDVATGNGQVAVILATKFKEVHATDISEKQLAQAPQLPNVFYNTEKAEHTSFGDECFDLITVAQAVHWLEFDSFYKEVNRILKDNGLFVAVGYGLPEVNETVDEWLHYFYHEIVGPFWDKERKWIDEAYKTIPFPFKEIKTPQLFITYNRSKQHFSGYLGTWSATQHYIKAKGENPLSQKLLEQLNEVWKDDEKFDVRFPLFIRAGSK